MNSNKILILLLGLITLILVLHLGGTYFYLYWRFDFYDRIVHLLSSFWITLAALTFFSRSGMVFTRKKSILLVGIGVALSIGILWEFFEYIIGQTSVADKEFLGDTIGDIVLDSVGGFIGSLYTITLLNQWNNKKPL